MQTIASVHDEGVSSVFGADRDCVEWRGLPNFFVARSIVIVERNF